MGVQSPNSILFHFANLAVGLANIETCGKGLVNTREVSMYLRAAHKPAEELAR